VHAGLARALDAPAATLFALALLASGFASSGVGTYAGQVVMQGFVQRRIPLFARRALTLAPALVVLSLGVDPTAPGVLAGGAGVRHPVRPRPAGAADPRPRADGRAGEPHRTTAAAGAAAAVIIALNAVLLWHTFT
jgi:manganese transport protein